MNYKRMAELAGVELTEASDGVEVSISKFPEVTQVSGFVPSAQDWERTLADMPLPALTTNVDRAAFRLMNLGVLALDAQGMAWKIYLTPHASDAQVDAAIEMARRALIPASQRRKADWLSGYRYESVDQGKRIGKILAAEFKQGGYDQMFLVAAKIEAGKLLPGLKDAKKWLVGALADIIRGTYPGVKLSKSETARLAMYRDDLRQ